MSDFARQQSEFQRGILTGDDRILAEILDSPKEKRETLFGVCRHAYGSKRSKPCATICELLHTISATRHSTRWAVPMSRQGRPEHPNLRWFITGLPDF